MGESRGQTRLNKQKSYRKKLIGKFKALIENK